MALPIFQAYQASATATTLVNNGTVRDLMTEKGALGLIPSNLKRETKLNAKGEMVYNRVLVLVYNGKIADNGQPESISISCSESVSRDLRAKNITLSELADYSILEDQNGINYISMPGTGVVKFNASELKTVAVSTKAVNHQDLIAL
jgi:hypothetical protein